MPEWHPGGHGLHFHFAVGRFIHRTQIVEAWGRGYVHIKLLGEVPMGGGGIGEARTAARYFGKYVAKGIEASHDFGRHRFDVAQGFKPEGHSVGRSEYVGTHADCQRSHGRSAKRGVALP